jgi:hypothetical protein
MTAQARKLAFGAVLMLPAAAACAEPDALFPPATTGCYVGTEITPIADGVPPYRNPAVPVTAVRLERGHPQLAQEDKAAPRTDGDRLINLRVIVTFADAGKPGATKRYANGLYDLLRCSADVCDANNYKVEREADGTVLLRMTGGMYIAGGTYGGANRHLPDGHVYRLVASPMGTCRWDSSRAHNV